MSYERREIGNIFPFSSLTQQVLNSQKKWTLIADFINNYVQKKTEQVEYYLVSHHDLGIHAEQNDNLERHETSKIEDRVQSLKHLRYRRPGEQHCGCGRVLHGITEEVKKQAEQRVSSRFIMYVLGTND